MYGQDILCGISKATIEIPHKIAYPHIGHRGPCDPYKTCDHNLCIGIIIFPHIDNPKSTGYICKPWEFKKDNDNYRKSWDYVSGKR